jgi:acetaldehyde dehydrogenase (acetylating)
LKKLKVAILGSGNIGTDLLVKVLRSSRLECNLFIGRKLGSPGMAKAISLGMPISDMGINAIKKNPDCCDLVFDATSAKDHINHAKILKELNKKVIDMTPSQVGEMCVPAVNLQSCINKDDVNMVTCGGQASIPISYAIWQVQKNIEYIEVVSSISSRSAGPATRANLDEYIETTENGNRKFSGCQNVKAILILNPAQPCIDMQTTIYAQMKSPNFEKINEHVKVMVKSIQNYVPGYTLIVPPTVESNRVTTIVKVTGLGDYLPKYAGNLDIINCAAIAMAEAYAQSN